jgi:hypothetical protein
VFRRPPNAAAPKPARGKDSRAARRADSRRKAARLASRRDSAADAEIGELPPVEHPERVRKCGQSLKLFLTSYFPRKFKKPFGKPHETLIGDLQRVIRQGGLKAVALPRGYGKTTIIDGAAMWAALYGYRRYVAYIASTGPIARKRIQSIKKALTTTDELAGDFPAVCVPLRKLRNVSQRVHSQTYQGQHTAVVWSATQIVLPTIAGATASGSVIECNGLLSAVRGLQHATATGEVIRPDIVIGDDPQTRKSAKSKGQTQQREELVTGDLLYLSGHDTPMACIISATVIYPDDLADRLTDRKRNPEWNGQREKMLAAWPDRMDMWDRYGDLRREELRAKGTATAATTFYRANRDAMDTGAVVTWEGLGYRGELSPLHHAMNLYYRDRASFFCEGQNDPEQPGQGGATVVTTALILAKKSEYPPLVCPAGTVKVTAFADVHKTVIYYAVAAYGEYLTGNLLAAGTWPAQGRHYFTLSTAPKTIQRALPTLGTIQAQILAALQATGAMLKGLPIQRPDGKRQPIDLLCVDGNWGETTDQVYQFAAASPLCCLVSHGRYYGARHKPIGASKQEAGTDSGPNWIVPPIRANRQTRAVVWDTNRWKADFFRALAAPPGTPGAWYLYQSPDDHLRMLAEHLLAESSVRTSGPYGEVDEYTLKPNEDNHLLDCCVGTLVAASVLKISRDGTRPAVGQSSPRPKRTVKF